MQAHLEGEKAAKAFMEERLISNNTDFFEPIKRHAIKSFKDLTKTAKINIKGKEEILRADRSLFARMAVIAQTREMNMREVLSHPLGPLPWSLATIDGSLAKTPKSKLVLVLEKDVAPLDEEPDATLWILDAMAILQSIRRVPETFGELAEQVFGTVMHIGRNAMQIDFVCDRYPEISIKNIERGKRGKGGSLNVQITGGAQKCPKQWKKFLSNGKNKVRSLKYL